MYTVYTVYKWAVSGRTAPNLYLFIQSFLMGISLLIYAFLT